MSYLYPFDEDVPVVKVVDEGERVVIVVTPEAQ